MYPVGVIHGRFQPLHNDHMKYLLAGMQRVNYMYIGISNPDPILTKNDTTDPNRSTFLANPCAFFERMHMVSTALYDEGYTQEEFCITPFPINLPEILNYYTPSTAVYFLAIYDEWGERKLTTFKNLNLQTEILWRSNDKGITGTEIREKIHLGEPWKHLVPPATVRIMEQFKIEDKIKRMFSEN